MMKPLVKWGSVVNTRLSLQPLCDARSCSVGVTVCTSLRLVNSVHISLQVEGNWDLCESSNMSYLALYNREVPENQSNMDTSHQQNLSVNVIKPIFNGYNVILPLHSILKPHTTNSVIIGYNLHESDDKA